MLKTSEALKVVGGISSTSAMPCGSWSIDARACITGSKLAKIPGTGCNRCYARKNAYRFPGTVRAMARRLRSLRAALADPIKRGRWIAAFVRLIGSKRADVWRWHDSGDLQSVLHLEMLAEIARQLPNVRFWLPTKEHGMVTRWIESGATVPKNMIIRLSVYQIDAPAPAQHRLEAHGVRFACIHDKEKPHGFECRKPYQGNECRDCRACWDPKVRTVSYKLH